jgi:hypothetical protein
MFLEKKEGIGRGVGEYRIIRKLFYQLLGGHYIMV